MQQSEGGQQANVAGCNSFKGISKNLLRVTISDLRCSPYSRTAALLGPTLSRSLRFLEIPSSLAQNLPELECGARYPAPVFRT